MKFTQIQKYLILGSIILLHSQLLQAEPLQSETIRLQQNQNVLEKQLLRMPSVTLHNNNDKMIVPFRLGQPESPCFAIHQFAIQGEQSSRATSLIHKIQQQSGFQAGMCLGTQSIQYLQKLAQNLAIDEGLITTQVYFAPQDLTKGVLTFNVEWGYLDDIAFAEKDRYLTAFGRWASFPLRAGEVLYLPDLEKGLENIRRLATVETHIQIKPSSHKVQHSHVIVERHQGQRFLVGIGINNTGSKRTGKYQGNLNLSFLNPLGANDLLYVNYNQDLGHHKLTYYDTNGRKTDSGTKGYSLHYSIPIRYWLWSVNHSSSNYREATKGHLVNYQYSGRTDQSNVGVNWLAWRDKQQRLSVGGKLWRLRIYKYIDGSEIGVQRRQYGGWEGYLNYTSQFNAFSVEANVSYKRGTGLFNSQPAPEEFNVQQDTIAGTSRMQIINASLALSSPFTLGKQAFSANSTFYAQWHNTPLTPVDQFNIGGEHSVRGFDGEQNLSGERGWSWQNTLNWHYQTQHKMYLAADMGYVSGISTQYLSRKRLVGMALGLTGQFQFKGSVDYQLSLGKPLSKPLSLKTAPLTVGFNLSYHF
ncbi:hemolysin activation/secretion protein [Nicoletella semolina]|uniref:Hemolysin activation/secretion protein n=1 Tax=Nicoletella semolina TaxID=271160 RepID=A0A4R2NBV5_9PAST|nr:ShlB/FhaC/HecB family hemolysin secretion/activation protein [Nicoletella semolina]MDH2925012.1 hypothetical protein [Nicoletella semolina]TCP18560.1 hemolysin activation/secretion protein [Nicoletella semolina]